jgi:hypothetical protein
MRPLPRQTHLREDIAVDTFLHSSFGALVAMLFHECFTVPSWDTFPALACGRALAGARHTITTYMWLTGAATLKHFSRFYVFLGGPPIPQTLPPLGGRHPCGSVVGTRRHAHARLLRRYDQEKSGDAQRRDCPLLSWCELRPPSIPDVARRELRLGCEARPAHAVAGHRLSVPPGLALSRKEPQAHQFHVPYRSRRQLARDILNFLAEQLPYAALIAFEAGSP